MIVIEVSNQLEAWLGGIDEYIRLGFPLHPLETGALQFVVNELHALQEMDRHLQKDIDPLDDNELWNAQVELIQTKLEEVTDLLDRDDRLETDELAELKDRATSIDNELANLGPQDEPDDLLKEMSDTQRDDARPAADVDGAAAAVESQRVAKGDGEAGSVREAAADVVRSRPGRADLFPGQEHTFAG